MDTLIIGRAEIAASLTLADCIDAVEGAFRGLAVGRMCVPAVVHIPADGGAFHIKSAAFIGSPHYVAVKVNGNFPDNPRTKGLPTIQGAIVLCDARDGSLLAVMDSAEVTAMRTGAATAVAARHLAPTDASVATVIGCRIQGQVQLLALLTVLPLATVFVFDTDRRKAEALVERVSTQAGVDVRVADKLVEATRRSQVIATCTSSRSPVLGPDDVAAGTFIAAVGADNHDKQELDVALMARARVVVDLVEQCASIGELHHALAAGAMTWDDVVAELADIVAGRVCPVLAAGDIIVFDSTGCAIQDVAAAGIIYERARASGAGLWRSLS